MSFIYLKSNIFEDSNIKIIDLFIDKDIAIEELFK